MKILNNPFLEANKNLNKKIAKLEKENQGLFWFKEKYLDRQKLVEELERRLREKNRVKVFGKKINDEMLYNLQITKLEHTPEGIFVEVILTP